MLRNVERNVTRVTISRATIEDNSEIPRKSMLLVVVVVVDRDDVAFN